MQEKGQVPGIRRKEKSKQWSYVEGPASEGIRPTEGGGEGALIGGGAASTPHWKYHVKSFQLSWKWAPPNHDNRPLDKALALNVIKFISLKQVTYSLLINS